MTLYEFLGGAVYWPLSVILISFAVVSTLSNISISYSEIYAQIKELKRVKP